MGRGNFDVRAYEIQAKEAKVSQNSGFTAKSMCDEFNPVNVNMRFSKKGPFNVFRDPLTVLFGLDVTGSMDVIPKSLLEGKLGSLMVDLKKTFNKPNENLQISFAGIGDAKSDQAPLQVTHFESDNRFAEQLQKIWLEGGGGGNGGESYNLLWWYAANKTHLNYVKQDGRKGILITIGDDNVHPDLTANEIQMWLDPKYDGGNISNPVLLKAVREQYDVYHIVITDGNAYRHDFLTNADKSKEQKAREAKQWANLLGADNVIYSESANVAEAIAKIITRHRPLEKEGMTNLEDDQWTKKNKENLTDAQWVEVLNYTLCPLTRQFMNNPVIWNEGKRACEKEAVEKYVREYQKDPMTQRKLNLSELVLKPNLNIAQLCADYKPFFEALPPERKERLIQQTLPQPIQKTVANTNSSNQAPNSAFFPQGQTADMVRQLENLQVSLECPIDLGEIMEDPVILVETGQTYGRKGIQKWLQTHDTCPNTHTKLTSKTLTPNVLLKNLCDEARKQRLSQQSDQQASQQSINPQLIQK